MSRQNKVNKDSYTQAGRLTPDDMARERQKQGKPDRAEQVKAAARTFTVREVTNRASGPRQKGGERASNRTRSAPEE